MDLLKVVINAIDDGRGLDTVVFDMQGVSPLFDYFVVCSGKTDRQVKAITKRITDAVNENKFEINHVEGKDGASWILIDLKSVIVNVFQPEERTHYELEKLWADIPKVDVEKLLK